MAIVTIDMRSGRPEELKRRFAEALLDAVCNHIDEARENVLLIIRENPGINFVENAQHLPEIGSPSPPATPGET
jgi:phenylpyruvate tautomerase PptA (4-oxalocrotonate tautomerase family)